MKWHELNPQEILFVRIGEEDNNIEIVTKDEKRRYIIPCENSHERDMVFSEISKWIRENVPSKYPD